MERFNSRIGLPREPAPQSPEKSQEEFSDGSKPLFNKYLKIAEDEDNKMTDGWKADADSVLVFVSMEVLLIELHVLT